MRFSLELSIAGAVLLFSEIAAAQTAPGPSSPSRDSAPTDEDKEESTRQSYAARKSWSVGAGFETNRTIVQEDVGGSNKAFNALSLFASYNITKRDEVRATGGFMQRFIADPTETGMRADDPGLYYAHRFALPWELFLGASVGNNFPVSYHSQLMGLIALPRASLSLTRGFVDNTLIFGIRGGAAYYIVEYREAAGQMRVNPRASTNVGASVSYSMPFHRNLSIHASGSLSWQWLYDPDHSKDRTIAEQFENTPVEPSADPYFTTPAVERNYGWEGSISYLLPALVDVQSQVQVAISQGDGFLREGATHLYWLSRRGGQVSASLSASY